MAKKKTAHKKHIEKAVKETKTQSEKPLIEMNKSTAITAVIFLLVGLIIGALLISVLNTNSVPNTGATTDASALKLKVANYLNENFRDPAMAEQGMEFTLEDSNNLSTDTLGFEVFVNADGLSQPAGAIVYVSGENFVIASSYPINVNDVPETVVDDTTNNQVETTAYTKSDVPTVDLYVMSFCPFGNKAEDTMLPVYNLLKDKVNWNIHYIVNTNGTSVSSLHGQIEVEQNQREACVLKNDGMDNWWNFTTYVNENCGSNGSCWEAAASELGLDIAEINTCVEEDGLLLMQENEAATNLAGATGSPTLIINGSKSSAVYQYGNSEAYKQDICSAFSLAPEECNTVIDSTTTSSGGSC